MLEEVIQIVDIESGHRFRLDVQAAGGRHDVDGIVDDIDVGTLDRVVNTKIFENVGDEAFSGFQPHGLEHHVRGGNRARHRGVLLFPERHVGVGGSAGRHQFRIAGEDKLVAGIGHCFEQILGHFCRWIIVQISPDALGRVGLEQDVRRCIAIASDGTPLDVGDAVSVQVPFDGD